MAVLYTTAEPKSVIKWHVSRWQGRTTWLQPHRSKSMALGLFATGRIPNLAKSNLCSSQVQNKRFISDQAFKSASGASSFVPRTSN